MGTHLSKTTSEGAVRTFLALDLPFPLKTELGHLRSRFVAHTPLLKWSAPDVLHITVKFLGGVAQSRLDGVAESARSAAASVTPFTLSLAGIGAFPAARNPRVIWVGLEEDAGYATMQRLFRAAEDALVARGFSPESRPFAPHITLARTRDDVSPGARRALGDTLQAVQDAAPIEGTWEVRELVVMRSDLGRSGPRYTPIATFPLGAQSTPQPEDG